MTSKERIYAAINNQPVDRIPFSFWKHFPKEEETGEKLAKALINFQKKFNFDLVKITPPASSIAEAWGSKYVYRNDIEGMRKSVRRCIFSPISNYKDWLKIKKINPKESILTRELDTVAITRSVIDKSVPIVHTIPSPLTVIKMLNNEEWIRDLKEHPEDLKAALTNITETIKKFSELLLQNGANGLFFYTHAATYDFLTEEEHKTFGQKYDLEIINELRQKTDLIILHIHGSNVMFKTLANYPVQIINWHDQLTAPSLVEGQKNFPGAILGGIEESEFLLKKKPEEIKRHIKNIIQQTGGKRLIIGPGCVLPLDIPEDNIKAVKEALE